MNYYDENDDRPKLYAGVAAAAYAVAMAAMLFLVYIPIKVAPENEMIIVEVIDEEPRPKPRPVVTTQAPRHQNLSTTRENTQQVTGKDEQTQTVVFHNASPFLFAPRRMGEVGVEHRDHSRHL